MGGDYGPVRTCRCPWKMGVTVFLSKVFLLDKGSSITHNTKYFRIFGCDIQTIIIQTSKFFLHFFLFSFKNPFELNVKFRNFPVKRQIFSHKTLHPDEQNFWRQIFKVQQRWQKYTLALLELKYLC